MEEFFGIIFAIAFIVFIIWLIAPSSKKKAPQTVQELLDNGIISWQEAKAIQKFEREEQIKSWVKHKLITPAQAAFVLNPNKAWTPEPQKIQKDNIPVKAKETTVQPVKTFRLSFVSAICYLALGSILLGIIALVAANYDKIPPAVRALSTLFLLCGVSFATFYTYVKGKNRAKEWFIVAGVGLIGANIGTISQWFQLSGNPMNALFWWAVLSVCFIALSGKQFWAYAWYPVVALTFVSSDYLKPVMDFVTYRVPSPLAGAFGIMTLWLIANQIAPNHNLVKVLKYWCVVGVVALCGLFDARLSFGHEISFPIIQKTGYAFRCIWALVILAAYPIYMMRQNKRILWALLGVLAVALFTSMVQIPIVGTLTTLFILMMIALYGAKQNSEMLFNTVLAAMFLRLIGVHFPSPMAGMMGVVTLTLIGYQMAPEHKLRDLFKVLPAIACILLAIRFDIDLTDQRSTSFPLFKDSTWALKNIWALVILSAYPIYVMRKYKLAIFGILGVAAIAILASLVKAPVLGIIMTLFLLSLAAAYVAKKNDVKSFNIMLFLMFIRLVLAYFHLFATLATTGVGLIVLGILILLGVWFYTKMRDRLFQYLQHRL